MAGGVCGGGHVWQGMCMAGGACMAGGCAWQGACMAGEIATAADGTHPTGMHSCLKSVLSRSRCRSMSTSHKRDENKIKNFGIFRRNMFALLA